MCTTVMLSKCLNLLQTGTENQLIKCPINWKLLKIITIIFVIDLFIAIDWHQEHLILFLV